MTPAVIILFCLLLSFLFSGMESGVLLLHRARIRYLKEKGSVGARILLDFLHFPGRLSSTVMVGNTIVNGVATVLVAQSFLRSHDAIHAIAAVFLFAFTLWFFGELVPKALFRRFPNRLTTLFAPLLLVAYWVFWPIVQVYIALSHLVVRLMGGRISPRKLFVTRDELKLLAKEGKEGVMISGEQQNLIANILDNQRATAKDIMRPKEKVITVPEASSETDRLTLSIRHGYSRFPVENASTGKWNSLWIAYDTLFNVRGISREAPSIPRQAHLEEVLSILRKARTQMGIVRDKEGRELGIVTVDDVLRRYIGKIDL